MLDVQSEKQSVQITSVTILIKIRPVTLANIHSDTLAPYSGAKYD